MIRATLCLLSILCVSPLCADPGNPAIDAEAHLTNVVEALRYRSTHRISEEQFLEQSRKPGTIVLDARSREKFALLHVEGALNLPFPDIDVDSLARLLPDKQTRILIYCNNNFDGAPIAMARKLPPASLNLSTFTTLYGYGYRNVFELEPLIDIEKARLPLVAGEGADGRTSGGDAPVGVSVFPPRAKPVIPAR